jgi:hypothetical protein
MLQERSFRANIGLLREMNVDVVVKILWEDVDSVDHFETILALGQFLERRDLEEGILAYFLVHL